MAMAVVHLADVAEESFTVSPEALVAVGLFAVVALSTALMPPPGRRVSTVEIQFVRDLIGRAAASMARLPIQPPGWRWTARRILRTCDRLETGAVVYADEVEGILLDGQALGDWRRRHLSGDDFAAERARALDILTRLSAELPPAPDPDEWVGVVDRDDHRAHRLSLGALIRQRRLAIVDPATRRPLTQIELARRLRVVPETVSRWEHEKGREPTPSIRRDLAAELGGVPSDYTREV